MTTQTPSQACREAAERISRLRLAYPEFAERSIAEIIQGAVNQDCRAGKLGVRDPVNHPEHYTSSPAKCQCGRGIECIQVAEHMNFCMGNALKYIWRADLKNDAIEDLEKAIRYLGIEIKRRVKDASAKNLPLS